MIIPSPNAGSGVGRVKALMPIQALFIDAAAFSRLSADCVELRPACMRVRVAVCACALRVCVHVRRARARSRCACACTYGVRLRGVRAFACACVRIDRRILRLLRSEHALEVRGGAGQYVFSSALTLAGGGLRERFREREESS